VDDSVAPEQVTVVALTREQAAELEWPDPELSELMSAVAGDSFGEVRGNDEVEAFPAFQEAAATAG
jgi:predicted GNAT superfamily acetyltransferase